MTPSAAAQSCASALALSLVLGAGVLAAHGTSPAADAGPGARAATAGQSGTGPAGGVHSVVRGAVDQAVSAAATAVVTPASAPARTAAGQPAEAVAVRTLAQESQSAPAGAVAARADDAPAPRAGVAAASGGGNAQQRSDARGRAALARLDYPYRDLGYTITFSPYRGGTLGTTNSRTREIRVYVKDSQSEQSLRATIAHEIGHALDFVHGTQSRHAEYRRVRGLPSDRPWYPCSGCNDYRSDAGDWSEVFAVALAGAGDFRSEQGPPPTRQQLEQLAPLFRVPARASASPRPTSSPSPRTSASPASRPASSGGDAGLLALPTR